MNYLSKLFLMFLGLFASLKVFAAGAAFTVTDLTETIANALVVVLAIGASVLVIWGAIRGFRWMRSAL